MEDITHSPVSSSDEDGGAGKVLFQVSVAASKKNHYALKINVSKFETR